MKLSLTSNCITCTDCGAEALQQFYPVHSNRKGTMHSLSIRNLPEVLASFRGIDETNIVDAPLTVQWYWYAEMSARKGIADLLANGPKGSQYVTPTLTLMRHQQLGREIAAYRKRFCFFFDTRTGKTPLSLAIIHDDIQKHPDHKWLVVCPLILIKNAWMDDAAKFVPDLTVVNCHAASRTARLAAIESKANIYITNVESFANYAECFKGFYGCIVDESSTMKSHKSKQGIALVNFSLTVQSMYLLSGTPAPNGEWEYYRQLQAIDYYSVPAHWTPFKERYFVDISFNQYEQLQLRVDRKEDFQALLSKYALYVDKEDVLKTPGREFIEVPLTLPDDLKEHYRTLREKLYIELQDTKNLTVPSAAAKCNKLNQLTSGFIIDTQAVKENAFYNEHNQEVYLLSMYRFNALLQLLQEQGNNQVLIWANYRKEFEIIEQLLGDKCMTIYGATSLQRKIEAIDAFKSGRIQYLVANPASADKGLTLTNCHICVYFSLNYSYELFKQSMERIYGDISKQPEFCRYYVMLTAHTIDEVMYHDVLTNKGSASMALLNHLKADSL